MHLYGSITLQSRAIVKMVRDCVRSRSRSRKQQQHHVTTESAAARAASEKVLGWYEQVQQEARQQKQHAHQLQQQEQQRQQEKLRYQNLCKAAANAGKAMQRECQEQLRQQRSTSTHAARNIVLSKPSQPSLH